MDNLNAQRREWGLLSSHGQVLALISRQPAITVRRLSDVLNFSERRIMGVLRDLQDAGMIERERQGRQNIYQVNLDAFTRSTISPTATLRNFLAAVDALPAEDGRHREEARQA